MQNSLFQYAEMIGQMRMRPVTAMSSATPSYGAGSERYLVQSISLAGIYLLLRFRIQWLASESYDICCNFPLIQQLALNWFHCENRSWFRISPFED